MKTIKKYLSQEEFISLFDYREGELFWKEDRGVKIKSGDFAGRIDKKGYFRVCISGKEYRRSRIIYIMHFGKIKKGLLIDHKNEIKSDDRIENLRVSTNSQNKNNTTRRVDNKSGFKGVSWKSANKKWQVSISSNGKNFYIGLFEKIEDAKKAYSLASIKYHKSFSKFYK